MDKYEIANKAFELVHANDEEGYRKFIESLTVDGYSLFMERMEEIEKLIESVRRIK